MWAYMQQSHTPESIIAAKGDGAAPRVKNGQMLVPLWAMAALWQENLNGSLLALLHFDNLVHVMCKFKLVAAGDGCAARQCDA
jgi:hypothetical protein